MKTGYSGTFVISWAQTDVDSVRAAPLNSVIAGVPWAWHGQALRVDGPQDLLRLHGAEDVTRLHARAGRRLYGPDYKTTPDDDDAALPPRSFSVTDGRSCYVISLIETARSTLLVFQDAIPPQGCDLWVVRQSFGLRGAPDPDADVICFAAGTMIRTQNGARPIETLRVGDLVQTKDNGLQPLLWTGRRRVSPARQMMVPAMRPIRLCAGALGINTPDSDLLVSPAHRVLVRGAVARDLFNTSEVLVPARDILRKGRILRDHSMAPVIYMHLLFERHQVIWANGVETESFHPADMPLSALTDTDRASLAQLVSDPLSYGLTARRTLTAPEAALLQHAA